jgi:hypothetical protein
VLFQSSTLSGRSVVMFLSAEEFAVLFQSSTLSRRSVVMFPSAEEFVVLLQSSTLSERSVECFFLLKNVLCYSNPLPCLKDL